LIVPTGWVGYFKKMFSPSDEAHRSLCLNGRSSWILLFLFLAVFGLFFTTPVQAQHPNIVVILADDLGYGDVSFDGCPDYTTPNIDSIAANGALCTDGYVSHPFCSPSRAGLITGRYQNRFGYENQPEEDPENPQLGLPIDEILLPQLLKPRGYVCGAVGKWHLGYAPNLLPLARGFDEFFGFLSAQSHYYDAKVLRGDDEITETSYLTDAFTREAVSFINRHATEPFFLYLPYSAVHSPFQVPPQEYMDRVANIPDYSRQVYAAMVIAMDDGVGQVLQTLEANNILDNTLIFFLSDNGAIGQDFVRNDPLRGGKKNTLEGGIRIPFAVQWPGHIPPNTVYHDIVSSLDIVPTVAAAAGISLPTDRVYDGVDIVPFLDGEKVSPPRNLFWRWFGLGPDGPPGSVDTIWAVRSGPLKLVTERYTVGLPPALYDLPNDISENTDLAATQPDDVLRLKQLYAQWENTTTIAPVWQWTQFPTNPVVMVGDWNRFDIKNTAPPWLLARATAPSETGTPDGFTWFTSTVHVAATGGDTKPGIHSFVLVGDETYSEQWGGASISVDGVSPLRYFSGQELGPTNDITLRDGFYYSFRVLDPLADFGPDILNLAVFQTSAPPVSVSWSGQTPAAPTSEDTTSINITTSHPPSAEEKVYLRWSVDTFLTSQVVRADGSGTSYSATIPPQTAGTLVQYSIATSTVDLTPLVSSGTIDSLTLSVSPAFRFIASEAAPTPTPTPTPGPPMITKQPADARAVVGATARFKVSATGAVPLHYQWRKNGHNIPRATKRSYQTPPTTIADNGSLFSVVASNNAGSVTSNDAILTVK
jgi:arylsulfatase A-like enzyme